MWRRILPATWCCPNSGNFGALDILVNNAGTTRFIDFPDLEAVQDEDWDRILAVNLKGPFQMARAAREALADGGAGVIVNTASIAGIVGAGSSIPYCASGRHNLPLLARTLGPEIVSTPWHRLHRRRLAPTRPGRGLRIGAQRGSRRSRAGEGSRADDIASGILAMIQATHTTGHILLDGGDTLGPRIVPVEINQSSSENRRGVLGFLVMKPYIIQGGIGFCWCSG